LPKIDVLIEIVDSRAPVSSYSGVFEKYKSQGKKHIILSNKTDLISEENTKIKPEFFSDKDFYFVNTKKKDSLKFLLNIIREKNADKLEKLKKWGIKNKPVLVMIGGMPNVGKTSIISAITGKNRLRIENRPGVTRSEQWISLGDINILDTPGVFYPEFNNVEILYKLAILNILKPQSMDFEKLFDFFWNNMNFHQQNIFKKHYKVENADTYTDFIECFGEINGIKGVDNIATRIFSDYNKGKFKQILLDNF
ncbi:MAG: GTPase, partial [Candidatus Muiribacteriota bacterium]